MFFLFFGGPWDSIVTLGTPLCQPWSTFLHDFRIWWDLGAQFAVFWAPFGCPWSPFGVFYGSGARPWTPFSTLLEKISKIHKKGKKKGLEMDVFSMKFQVFPQNAKLCFDCAGASGLWSRPLLFLLCASIFALPFLHCFF